MVIGYLTSVYVCPMHYCIPDSWLLAIFHPLKFLELMWYPTCEQQIDTSKIVMDSYGENL